MTKTRALSLSPCLLLLAILVIPAFLWAQETAKPTPSEQSAFDVIGISARTNNAAEMGPNGEIPKLWQRLFAEDVLSRIPDRNDESIVAVYTNYANDANGDYTCLLGAKVAPGTKAPDGMASITVHSGKYLEFISAKGPGQEVVPAVWRQIYGYFTAPGAPARAFKTDFERYDAPFDPNAMQAHIFIGVKP